VTGDLFRSAIVPLANRADATATARALAAHVGPDDDLTVVHVVQKAGGAPDKASVEQREEYAEEVFEAFRAAFEGAATVETEIYYGTDVAETILDAGRDQDASAVVYTSRGLSGWVEFLTGDVAGALVDAADRPVVVLPNPGD